MIAFINWLFEAKLPKKFKVQIENKVYNVIRTSHVLTPRNGDYKPRDFKMSIEKYQKVLSTAFHKIIDNKPTTITWTDTKNNAMVVVFENEILYIISVINNSDRDNKKLFDKSPNIIHI